MEQKEFRLVGKMYKKIAGKRFRLPRKVKKRFKTNTCKHGWDIKKLRFSYKRLNRDIKQYNIHDKIKWSYVEDKLNKYEKAYENKTK